MPGPNINHGVPGACEYYPLNVPVIGSALSPKENDPILFKPLTIKGVTFANRIFVSPMCQYSANDGHATDWHLVHLGGFATRGAGAICVEAASVVPEGRISPEDLGIWKDSHIAPLKRIVDFVHAQGTKIGIQLAHAGRKASTYAPWVKDSAGKGSSYAAREDENGWPDNVLGPSDIPYSARFPQPKALSEEQLTDIEDAFVAAIERCKEIGFDFIELHAAHGYLLHSFVSPLSNLRTDAFGGQPLANRLRFPLRVVARARAAWADRPLFVRISATDWAEGAERGGGAGVNEGMSGGMNKDGGMDEGMGEGMGKADGTWKQWGIEQSTIYAGEMLKLGVDLVDCSSGANWEKQKIPVGPGYQVPFAEAIKRAHPALLVGAVGLITDPLQAESYLRAGKADVVFLARELLRQPHWPIIAARALGVGVKTAVQYERGWEGV